MPEHNGFSVDPSLWENLKADSKIPKDDPQLIAKFALGFSTPRISSLKLKKHPLFGAFVGMGYPVVLQEVVRIFPDLAGKL